MAQDGKPKDKLNTYGHLIYDKGNKNIQGGEKTVSSTSGAGKTQQLHVKERN